MWENVGHGGRKSNNSEQADLRWIEAVIFAAQQITKLSTTVSILQSHYFRLTRFLHSLHQSILILQDPHRENGPHCQSRAEEWNRTENKQCGSNMSMVPQQVLSIGKNSIRNDAVEWEVNYRPYHVRADAVACIHSQIVRVQQQNIFGNLSADVHRRRTVDAVRVAKWDTSWEI